ncbi:DUF1206 domain-containing protein [Azospirillum sp. ST 5-10]|uniref:DUF1206 domain-containing protein n=1 Tax=unclassified Azospirillum TaxID=2630922 RepID=UPI003F49F54E
MQGLARFRGVEGLARLGYAARGLVYLVVGWFAVLAAEGRGSPTDTKGALVKLLTQPMGAVLLGVVALGLAAYALWRIAEAALDVDGRGREPKALATRAAHVASGLLHLSLAAAAVGLLATGHVGNGDSSARDWTAWLMAWPLGRWLVAAVGVAVIAAAFAHFARAWTAGFCRHLTVSGHARRIVEPLGRAGYAARGVVFTLVGLFFLTAAWQADASESGGLRQALRTLQDQPYGPSLLLVVAAGLVAFGLFGFVQAAYRRIDVDRAERKVWRVVT